MSDQENDQQEESMDREIKTLIEKNKDILQALSEDDK